MKKLSKILAVIFIITLNCTTFLSTACAYNTSTVGQANILALGEDYTAVIASNKTLWMWGRNSYNQNLSGDTSNYAKVPIKAMDDVSFINCGRYSNAIIKLDGSLWMWGNNTYGQFVGEYTYALTKVMEDVVAVSCGANHFAAIKTDGSLWTWGKNSSGQLGIGSIDDEIHDPIKVMDEVVTVSCGDAYTAAIKKDGSLWTWGININGELGNGTTENSGTPVKVMSNVSSVSCGELHTAAIKDDGTLWLWGYNRYGELGNGTSENSSVPVKVMNDVSFVNCGGIIYSSSRGGYTAAIKTDGTLWMWGRNSDGQLGIGTHEHSNVPVKVMDNVAAVSCAGGMYSGNGHTAVVKTDGTVWTWGANRFCQLGNGTNNTSHVPIRVSGIIAALPESISNNQSGNITTHPNQIQGFIDVSEGAYYFNPIQWAIENQITSGTSTTTFSPNETCTNAQILSFLWRANGSPEPTIKNPFADVKNSDYYYKAALWAYENGLVSGSFLGSGTKCTRSMTVEYLWKVVGSPSSNKETTFTDVPANADYAKAVAWAVEKGITSGTGATTFSPNETCTRAQIVTFLYRIRKV